LLLVLFVFVFNKQLLAISPKNNSIIILYQQDSIVVNEDLVKNFIKHWNKTNYPSKYSELTIDSIKSHPEIFLQKIKSWKAEAFIEENQEIAEENKLQKDKTAETKDTISGTYKTARKIAEELVVQSDKEQIIKETNIVAEPVEEKTTFANVVFKIQVAASHVPVSKEEKDRFLKGYELLEVEKTKDWYRYMLKAYSEEQEAISFVQNSSLSEALVVEYRDGKRSEIKYYHSPETESFVMPENLNTDDLFVFRVQVAADDKPLSERKLRKRYNGKRIVNKVFEEGWYRYSIGDFVSLNMAREVKNETEVKDAFISVYQNNRKISDKDVKKILDRGLTGDNKLFYTIQISAKQELLNEEEVRSSYSGTENITIRKIGDWYKYSVGHFETYEEATRFKNSIQVKGAFTVAYIEGRIIPIQKAIELSKK